MGNSKRKLTRLTSLIIILLLVISVTACSNKGGKDSAKGNVESEEKKNDNSETSKNNASNEKEGSPFLDEIVLTIDKEEVSFGEAILYLKYIQTHYEDIFGSGVWDYNLGTTTIGELAKQDIINTIVERKITKKYWDKAEVVITEEDEANIKEYTDEYLKGLTDEDINYYGITKEIVYLFFFDNLMVERVYDATTMSVDTNVSDEEAKQITIQYLLVSTKKTDNKGEIVPISEGDKQAAYVQAQELLIEAATVEDFESFAKSNTDDPQIEKTFGKNEVEQVVEDAAFALKTGEISSIIESQDGYLILYSVDDYNEDATLDKKEEIIDKRQSEEFQRLFEQWQEDVDIELNDKVWDEVGFD